MQFVNRGPDIPDNLLQAHEEGRVVFFCGAGISYPAGLPGFDGLVDRIYKKLGTTRTAIEGEAFNRKQFDATLDILEHRLAGQRVTVRRALADSLRPDLKKKGATETHAALLQLARSRDETVRLVTTNFDRIFEHVAKRDKRPHAAYAAPMLPIPKNSRWNGVVYLHGLLPSRPDESSLNRLIVTSGDFGLAYLTERWAARFVSELFRNYVVCFVGYSINDPILRYMMDALAADKMLGEDGPQAYAFGDCTPGHEAEKIIEWEAKGVTPILYEVPAGTYDHSALHATLKVWSETYRDGVLGKERIVLDYALARPAASSRQDDFVGRMLWAISHQNGSPAKVFADHNPVPSLDWLKVFSDERFQHTDLIRFGIVPNDKTDRELRFSLLRRPASYNLSSSMSLVTASTSGSQWDAVMFQMARWLVRHLNSPELIFWIVERGHQLNETLCVLIEHNLDHYVQLQEQGKQSDLDAIRANAPNAVPNALMQVLWRLLLTGRVKSQRSSTGLHRWHDRLKRDGLTMTLRMELRDLLTPKISLRRPFRFREDDAIEDTPERLSELVSWDLELATDYVYDTLVKSSNERWKQALPALIDEFQRLLHDALELLTELGEVNERSDRSYWSLPSIEPHWQNRQFNEWTALIELLRDAWIEVRKSDPVRAANIARAWFPSPYPTFKRLGLFAASQDDCIDSTEWVEWLSNDLHWWLWAGETQRETMRLIVTQGMNLTPALQKKLEDMILAGPPRSMLLSDLADEKWDGIVNHYIWLHLAKLRQSGAPLGDKAQLRLDELETNNPDWELSPFGKEEFPSWMSGTGDPDFEEDRRVDIAPRKRPDLVQWLGQPMQRDFLYQDTWSETCRTRFFHCIGALCDLAQVGNWPPDRWRQALQVWSEEKFTARAWRFASPVLQGMPADILQELANSLSWWLEAVSKVLTSFDPALLALAERIFELPLKAESGISENDKPINEPIMEAINHPIGHVTQALLNLWLQSHPSDDDALPNAFREIFNKLCDVDVARFRHARVLLSANLIALFRVDRAWTESYLFPLLRWDLNPNEARSGWEGFFWSPRLYMPLLIAFKEDFLDTARHYDALGKHAKQYATFITYAALNNVQEYSQSDFRDAVGCLPQEGLQRVSQALYQALEGAGEQREDYWVNRIHPFWLQVWPKSLSNGSKKIAENFARMALAAGNQFPSAFEAIKPWLQPIAHPDYLLERVAESGVCQKFPDSALSLVDGIVGDGVWVPMNLGRCLEMLKATEIRLEKDARYMRLFEYYRTKRY